MGSSGLLTGHHVTAAMVGETRQQHRPQTQQVRVMLVSFQFRVTLCLSALKSPCFLLCPAQMWGSHSHTGKDYGYPRGSRWPQDGKTAREPRGLPRGCQQRAPTLRLLSHTVLPRPTHLPISGRKTHLPSPLASVRKGSCLLKTKNPSIIYSRCLLHRLLKSQGSCQAQSSMKLGLQRRQEMGESQSGQET